MMNVICIFDDFQTSRLKNINSTCRKRNIRVQIRHNSRVSVLSTRMSSKHVQNLLGLLTARCCRSHCGRRSCTCAALSRACSKHMLFIRDKRNAELTRSSAIAEGPRDASCQLKSCQLPRNSAETT